jgi:hypothetical protein
MIYYVIILFLMENKLRSVFLHKDHGKITFLDKEKYSLKLCKILLK